MPNQSTRPKYHPENVEFVNEFIEQDFSLLPEGRSETLTLGNVCLVRVNPDPFKKGYFCLTATDLLDGSTIAGAVIPLDDLTRKLRTLVDKLAVAVDRHLAQEREEHERQFRRRNPNLE